MAFPEDLTVLELSEDKMRELGLEPLTEARINQMLATEPAAHKDWDAETTSNML